MRELLVTMLLATVSPASVAVWVVRPDGTGDAPTIQAAIALAAAGDTILLAAGTFTGPGNRDVDFSGKDVIVTSQSGSASTIIDCEGMGRAFLLLAGETSAATISELTIRNGDSPSILPGGAVYCINSSPTIRDCVFEQNVGGGDFFTGGGGAIYCLNAAHVTLDGCLFTENSVPSADGVGGAVAMDLSDATITNCVFDRNSTADTQFAGGGGLFVLQADVLEVSGCTFTENTSRAGAGLCVLTTERATVTGCEIAGNVAGSSGGGFCSLVDDLTVSDCSFAGNEGGSGGGAAVTGGGVLTGCVFLGNVSTGDGGALFTSLGVTTLRACTLVDNSAGRGGGVGWTNSHVNVESCTFYHNIGEDGGNLFVRGQGTGSVDHSILSFGVGPAVTCIDGSTVALSCTDVFGNIGGDWVGCISGQGNVDDNFSADPFFCEAPDDLGIRSDSPCAPPGVTGCGLVGSMGVSCGPVALVEATWGTIKLRYRDRPQP
jgi:hypothetical protein